MTPEPTVLGDYLDRTRWFGGKGRDYEVTEVTELARVPGGAPDVAILLVEVTYGDAEGGREFYQVPVVHYPDPEHRLDHAFIGWWEDPERGWVHGYDALHDREAMALWLRAFASDSADADTAAGLRFRRLPGHDLDLDAQASLFSGEQSNSTVMFGEDALMKVFRKITPGANPDITVHDVLTRAGSHHIAHLYGWLEHPAPGGEIGGEPLHLAMLQEFLRTATDGWDLALSSVRALLSDPTTRASDSGGDFAGEATRLGEALGAVHHDLTEHFAAEERPAAAAADLADAMSARLDAALEVVPDLAAYADGLRAQIERVRDLEGLAVQQVHGDLHLGQTLRTSSGWKIVDFEGEPAKPLAERRLPDSRWRDVAGMLRSFDYAPRVALRSLEDADDPDSVATEQADQWAERTKNHFLVAYAGGRLSESDQVLLDAYVADKAVYEAVYEARNRPAWVEIPLAALSRMGAA